MGKSCRVTEVKMARTSRRRFWPFEFLIVSERQLTWKLLTDAPLKVVMPTDPGPVMAVSVMVITGVASSDRVKLVPVACKRT